MSTQLKGENGLSQTNQSVSRMCVGVVPDVQLNPRVRKKGAIAFVGCLGSWLEDEIESPLSSEILGRSLGPYDAAGRGGEIWHGNGYRQKHPVFMLYPAQGRYRDPFARPSTCARGMNRGS